MKVEHLPYTTQGNAMTRCHKALSKWIYKDPLHKEQKDAHVKKKYSSSDRMDFLP
jgi:hypothetical protein